jgi:LacI family transcriptional regulator
MQRVTIKTVAEEAGVSKTTVSHVLNKTRFVEEETRQRVLQAIDRLGYRPSLVARSLTTNRTETIGVVVSDISNNFFGDLIRGIEDFTGPKNYSLVVCNTDETLDRENHYLDLLLRQRVDGIIVAAASQRWEALNIAEMQHTPIVYTDRRFEGMHGPYAGADNMGGAQLGTNHLIQCGHQKIGMLAGFQRLSSMRERLAGFQCAMEQHGLPVFPQWIIESHLGIEEGREAAHKILSMPEHPTALFINNNYLSLGTLLALNDMGLSCPGDVSILGFDDHPWSAVSCPPLTVIRQPARQIGQAAAQMVEMLINGEQPDPLEVELPCELVLRSSC